MQSFLKALTKNRRFIEDFAVYAAALYELREVDFHEMARIKNRLNCHDRSQTKSRTGNTDSLGKDRDRWEKAMLAVARLKAKIATTRILKHFDPDRPPVIVLYAK